MSGLRPGNSWSMQWRPTSNPTTQRQFQLMNGNPDANKREGAGRGSSLHTHSQFRQPLSHSAAAPTGGYHLSYSDRDIPTAQPIPAKKRRVEPQDLDDNLSLMDLDTEDTFNVSPELLGDPREYLDETGDVMDDGSGKRKRPTQNLVSVFAFSFGLLLLKTTTG